MLLITPINQKIRTIINPQIVSESTGAIGIQSQKSFIDLGDNQEPVFLPEPYSTQEFTNPENLEQIENEIMTQIQILMDMNSIEDMMEKAIEEARQVELLKKLYLLKFCLIKLTVSTAEAEEEWEDFCEGIKLLDNGSW